MTLKLTAAPNFLQGIGEDATVAKYVGMGLTREAVVLGVAIFGDVHSKVFVLNSGFAKWRHNFHLGQFSFVMFVFSADTSITLDLSTL